MKAILKFWLIALTLPIALAGCKDGGETKKAAEPREYDFRGKVTALNPAKPAVTIDHEDIPGLMTAMEMPFKVEDPKLLEGIKAGDQVQGRVKKTESGVVITWLEKRP